MNRPALAIVAEAVDLNIQSVVARAIAAREQGEKSSWVEADCYLDLAGRGWTQQRIAEKCETEQSRVSRFAACAKNYGLVHKRPSFWQAFHELREEKKKDNHRAQGTGENEWYTPSEYVEAARSVLGAIDLDPASSDAAQEIVRAASYFTRKENGLTREWHGKVWLNPPYAQPAIQQFIEKAVEEYRSGRVSEAIVLTHNYTDTAWFHTAVSAASAILFTRGRIGFLSPDGEKAAPTQGQAFFYFGKRVDVFAGVFSGFGFVVGQL